MDETYPDLNNQKILFREAALCLKKANMISENTFLGIHSATAWAKEAKGMLRFSAEELKGFELLMKARLRELYSWLSTTVPFSHSDLCSHKIEIELLNRAIDVLKCGSGTSMTILARPKKIVKAEG